MFLSSSPRSLWAATLSFIVNQSITHWFKWSQSPWLQGQGIRPRQKATAYSFWLHWLVQRWACNLSWSAKTKNTEVNILSLLQWIFPTQESNWGLLYCRWILYQLSYQGSSYGHGFDLNCFFSQKVSEASYSDYNCIKSTQNTTSKITCLKKWKDLNRYFSKHI